MATFLSSRFKNLKIGIQGYTDNTEVANFIGNVNINGSIKATAFDDGLSSGQTNYVISADGLGGWSWKSIGEIGSSVSALDDLVDVDLSAIQSPSDGRALIYQNGEWVAGPVIGGVNYASGGDPLWDNVRFLVNAEDYANGATTWWPELSPLSLSRSSIFTSYTGTVTTAKAKFGTKSLYFAANNYTTFENSNFVMVNYTMECWINPTNVTDTATGAWFMRVAQFNTNGAHHLSLDNGYVKFVETINNVTTPRLTHQSFVPANQWTHVALTVDQQRKATLYVNGIASSTTYTGTSTPSGSYDLFMFGSQDLIQGVYLDDIRYTTGVRYTGNFTPPTSAFFVGPPDIVTNNFDIDKLYDVDTTTTPPSDGQVLTWASANSQWKPGTLALALNDLTDVDATSSNQGYKHTQGSYLNSGQFQLNGGGLLINYTSQNGLGQLPSPTNNGSLWFSLNEYGPFTKLTIVGTIGSVGSIAWSIPGFVDRSPLDAVLTGSTVVYFHTVNPARGPYNEQTIAWSSLRNQWETYTLPPPGAYGLNELTDVDLFTNLAQGYKHTQGSYLNSGQFQLNGGGLLINHASQNGLGQLPSPANNGSLWFSLNEYGPFTELTIVGNIGSAGSIAWSIPGFVDRSPLDAVLTGSTVVYFHTVNPVIGPSDGQILTFNSVSEQWEVADAAPAAAITGLNIREEGILQGGANAVSTLDFMGSYLTATVAGNVATIAMSESPTFIDLTLTGGLYGPTNFVIDPAVVGDDTGTVEIKGNLIVQGTTTTINSTTLTVDDKNIELGVVDTPTDAAADGGGITLRGTTNKTLNWIDSTDSWTSSENIDLASGKTYKIAGTNVLSATALGTSVQISASNIPSGVITSTMIADGTIANIDISASAAIVDTKLATISTAGKVSNSATTATSSNTANAIVTRDGSGNFTAGTITATLTGAASLNVLKSGDTMTGTLGLPLGTVSAPSLYFTGDANTGIYSPGADKLALTTGGAQRLLIDTNGNVGIGVSTSPGYKLEVNGSFAATTKSFIIDHPTKDGMKLRYGSLEGPENGVYVRGRSNEFVIELPEYWTKLIDENSITVNLTPIGNTQTLWVNRITNNKIYIGSKCLNVEYFYTIFGERKDVEKLEVEF